MRGASIARHLIAAASLAGVLGVAQSCDQAAPAAPTASVSGSGSSHKPTDDDDDDSGSEAASGSDSFGAAGAGTGTSSASGTDDAGGFKRDGAQSVGDDNQKKEVKDCGATGKLYDRFATTPICTASDLAKIDCTEDGIKAALKDNDHLLGQFKDALGASYSGFEIDQCVDCPFGSQIPQCATSTPPSNGGTKVLFVKTDGTQVKGKTMMLPIRPSQN